MIVSRSLPRLRALGYHSLRHSFVSRLANLEVLPDVRRQLAGHSSDEIHRRYVHLDLFTSDQGDRKAAQRLAKNVMKSSNL
jgi:integrase